jgi:hypothetical protein
MGSNPTKCSAIKIHSLPHFGGEVKLSTQCHKIYIMLHFPAEYGRDISSAKFKGISYQLPALIPDISAATRWHWWMNQD